MGLSEAGTHPHGAELFHSKGSVQVKALSTVFVDVEKGEFFTDGDIIKTGPNALAIIRFPDNSTLRILPNTEITIEKLAEPVEDSVLGSTNIFLKIGQLFINVINEEAAPIFHVKTTSVAMGVRGTRFFAGIDESTGHTELAVDKGVVEISNPSNKDHKEAIEAGHGIHVEEGKFTHPQKYDWVRSLDYNTEKKTIDVEKNKSLHLKKRAEFSKKRKEWVRDENKWNLHNKKWALQESKHKSNSEKLKKKRELFNKKRKEFNLRKKNLSDKSRSISLKSKALVNEGSQLKRKEKSLRQQVRQFKTGRKDPRLKLQISKKTHELKKEKIVFKAKRKALKDERTKLIIEKKSLIKKFKRVRSKKKSLKNTMDKQRKKLRRAKKRRRLIKKQRPKAPSSGQSTGGNTGGSL